MNDTSENTSSTTTAVIWAAATVIVLGGIGTALAAALGVHGFGRGMLIGAALALVALGSVVLGLVIARARGRSGTGWLPSRDGSR